MENFLPKKLYFHQLTIKIFILIIINNLLIAYAWDIGYNHHRGGKGVSARTRSHDAGHHHHGNVKGGGGPVRTRSESIGHRHCIPPKFKPKNPNVPQQVHLALTNNPGEMNITWITFHNNHKNRKNLSGVYTFVEYWKMEVDAVEAKQSKRILLASRIRHEYTDTIDIKCSKEDKPKNWNKMIANIRYIHTITLQGLEDNKRYGYKVGYCVPAKIKVGASGEEKDCVCLSPHKNRACKLEYRKDKTFNFKMFPWKNSGNQPFTFLVFGDLGLRKPDNLHIPDIEKSSENSNYFDSLAPQSMQALVELVHRPHNPGHPMLWKWKGGKKLPKAPHRILKSHLNKNSSGLQMNEIQMILHIGDIAYDLHQWRARLSADGTEVYNLGDRFMHIIEDVAAYVPYMVAPGNHENEEKKSKRPDPPGAEAHFDPQYEHYESRFNMPKNFNGHNTNQFFHVQTGPFWIQFVSTEYYFSYSTPTWQWIPDYKRVQEQYDFTEYSLIKANMNRDKYPWLIVVQHRPFYCTSKNRFTCRDNKTHKNGIPDPDDPSRIIYGLEELYNKYYVDLVITGHEHTFEMFPPIQLHNERNRVIPYKYWWHANRNETHWMEENEAEAQQKNWKMRNGAALIDGGGVNLAKEKEKQMHINHEFIAYIDPVAPLNLIVGRPGNMEDMEKLSIVAHLQRVKQYNWFSFTMVHYPGSNAEIFVRQVDPQNGFVPIEFALKKTISTYNREVICHAIDDADQNEGKQQLKEEEKSLFFMQDSGLIHAFDAFTASEQYLRKRISDPEEFSIHFMLKWEKRRGSSTHPPSSQHPHTTNGTDSRNNNKNGNNTATPDKSSTGAVVNFGSPQKPVAHPRSVSTGPPSAGVTAAATHPPTRHPQHHQCYQHNFDCYNSYWRNSSQQHYNAGGGGGGGGGATATISSHTGGTGSLIYSSIGPSLSAADAQSVCSSSADVSTATSLVGHRTHHLSSSLILVPNPPAHHYHHQNPLHLSSNLTLGMSSPQGGLPPIHQGINSMTNAVTAIDSPICCDCPMAQNRCSSDTCPCFAMRRMCDERCEHIKYRGDCLNQAICKCSCEADPTKPAKNVCTKSERCDCLRIKESCSNFCNCKQICKNKEPPKRAIKVKKPTQGCQCAKGKKQCCKKECQCRGVYEFCYSSCKCGGDCTNGASKFHVPKHVQNCFLEHKQESSGLIVTLIGDDYIYRGDFYHESKSEPHVEEQLVASIYDLISKYKVDLYEIVIFVSKSPCFHQACEPKCEVVDECKSNKACAKLLGLLLSKVRKELSRVDVRMTVKFLYPHLVRGDLYTKQGILSMLQAGIKVEPLLMKDWSAVMDWAPHPEHKGEYLQLWGNHNLDRAVAQSQAFINECRRALGLSMKFWVAEIHEIVKNTILHYTEIRGKCNELNDALKQLDLTATPHKIRSTPSKRRSFIDMHELRDKLLMRGGTSTDGAKGAKNGSNISVASDDAHAQAMVASFCGRSFDDGETNEIAQRIRKATASINMEIEALMEFLTHKGAIA